MATVNIGLKGLVRMAASISFTRCLCYFDLIYYIMVNGHRRASGPVSSNTPSVTFIVDGLMKLSVKNYDGLIFGLKFLIETTKYISSAAVSIFSGMGSYS